MESGFLTFILVSSFAVHSSHAGITDWEDVVVVRAGSSTTLVCTDAAVSGPVTLNWKAKSPDAKEWKLVLSASARKTFSGSASKASMRLTDPNFQETGVFSLFFFPEMKDTGLYSCLIQQGQRKLKERIILLAILRVAVLPSPIIPLYSTLRMLASVTPLTATSKITWTSPDGTPLKSEKTQTDTEAKLPLVQPRDDGVYVCTVHSWGSSSTIFPFGVNVTVDAKRSVSLNAEAQHERETSTATLVQTPLFLLCPSVKGDYVSLQWNPPDKINKMQALIQYDRWRDTNWTSERSTRIQLADSPYNAKAGSFSFLLTPEYNDGGTYVCEVYLNDKASVHSTKVSVMKVKTTRSPSKLDLRCQYTERSQVQSVRWKHQNTSRQLPMSTSGPGIITTVVPLPITSDTAGNYTCTLKLKNGRTIWATQAVTLPPEEHVGVAAPSMLPSLSALLLLVPLVAAAVGGFLWKQKQISDRDIEYSLSVQSREVENIYENPDDIRQGPPLGLVYMDLKPRGDDDVYKELERNEQCQS